MRIKFITNLGTADAKRLGLDFQHSMRGMECEVSGDCAGKLVASGLAIEGELPAKVPLELELKAVPPIEIRTAPEAKAPAVEPSHEPASEAKAPAITKKKGT